MPQQESLAGNFHVKRVVIEWIDPVGLIENGVFDIVLIRVVHTGCNKGKKEVWDI